MLYLEEVLFDLSNLIFFLVMSAMISLDDGCSHRKG